MRNIRYRIPNVFLQMFDKAAELKIATVFYTLTNKQSMRNINGDYVLSVSQETLSRLSGLSVSTIKRTVDKLCAQGFIVSQTRPKSNRRADNGALMLDKYLYTIKYIPRNSDYFCVDRTALRKVNGQAFEVYMHFSMLSDSITRAFFHSLTDLCDIIKIGKKELIKAIETLIKHKLIRKIYRVQYDLDSSKKVDPQEVVTSPGRIDYDIYTSLGDFFRAHPIDN